jgi:hypothetical protein
MDWQLAITRNTEALTRFIAALFALSGLVEGKTALPRPIYRAILLVLRPAESAVRRLIMIVAHRLGQNFGGSLLNSSATAKNNAQWWKQLSKLSPKFPLFQLIDPLKPFVPSVSLVVDGDDRFDDEVEISDNHFVRSLPRISVPGYIDPVFAPTVAPSTPYMIDAKLIFRRLQALKLALENLPKQARRLARWRAKRDFNRQQFPQRTGRLSPFRPGLPPGYRQRPVHEVDAILRECHGLMLDIRAEQDTS